MQDRYGEPPPAVVNLLEYASLKLLCVKVGVIAVERKRETVSVRFLPNATIDPERLARFVSSLRGAQFTPDGTLKFPLKTPEAFGVLRQLRAVLEELAAVETATTT